jgi:hypothetical protein
MTSRSEPGDAGVVHQDIDGADVLDERVELRRLTQVGGHEAGPAAARGDGIDHRRASGGMATVHDDLRALAGELLRGRLANAGRGARDQGGQALEVLLSVHDVSFQLKDGR